MKRWYYLCLVLLPHILNSQSILTLNETIRVAMEQNYGIQISVLEQTADAMEVYKANAGMGPILDWNASFRATGNNVKQNYLDGRVVKRWGRSINPNTDISLGMTLYDGGRMQATYERLGLYGQYSELQGKLIIQSTIVDVMLTYYEIIKHKKTVSYLNTIIKYYKERLNITEERWLVGKGSKLDFLQSKTDLNVQLSELAKAGNNLKNSKVVLNGLLNRHPSLDFDVEESKDIQSNYELSQLENQAINKNRDILLMQKAMDISYKQEVEIAAARKPQVFLNGSIGYAYSNTNTGFLSSSQNFSGGIGVSANWNLFDGNHRKNQIAIARINSNIIEKQHESLEFQIHNDLIYAYNQYLSDKELLQFEEENKSIAEENLSISIEKFRLGGSSILELSEAQRAYDTALNRLVDSAYNIKISELNLLRLSGSLVE